MQLTATAREIFAQRGILFFPGAIGKNVCSAIQLAILSELDRLKLRVNGKPAAASIQHLPIFQQSGALAQKVKLGSKLDTLFSPELLALMSTLAGAQLLPALQHPQLLLSFPHKESWSLDRLNWHLDLAVPKRDETSGVQAFAILDDLQPRGGATLLLAGSHRLPYLEGSHGGSAVSVLREHPTLGSLFGGPNQPLETLFRPQSIQGVDVQLVELNGRAGDIYLMDLRVLHSPSFNATKKIRMMATNRYTRRPSQA